ALNTASHAANLGISVLAFPGDVDRPKVAGCLALIRDGATLVRGADDVLEAIGRRALRAPSRTPQLDAESRRVVAALAGGEVPFDRLVEQLALEPGGLAAILMELELRGLIEARAGAHYALANG
ncbi:MAG: DNA-protecting protein DprA, partial [Candidatus Eremiobacteraeota bacterium]|nr:DNA-protecting protein DprA [Candidatus Eremiobacteraeota bacterium]